MDWYQNLYIGRSLKKKEDKLRKEMENGHYRRGIKILTLASNGRDLLDIRSALSLAGPYLRERPPRIIGLAGSKEEAFELVEKIASDCIRETGDVKIREFLSDG